VKTFGVYKISKIFEENEQDPQAEVVPVRVQMVLTTHRVAQDTNGGKLGTQSFHGRQNGDNPPSIILDSSPVARSNKKILKSEVVRHGSGLRSHLW